MGQNAVRTLVGSRGGDLSGACPDDLAVRLTGAAELSGASHGNAGDVSSGCADDAGKDSSRDVAQMAALPAELFGVTVNRLCASGLEAVNQAVRTIRLSEVDLTWRAGWSR